MNNPLNIHARLIGIAERLVIGCGNHGCRIYDRHGMGTNASCKCDPRSIKREINRIIEDITDEPWTIEVKESKATTPVKTTYNSKTPFTRFDREGNYQP